MGKELGERNLEMKALIQRVSEARVHVGGRLISEIQRGLLIFLCVVKGDRGKDLSYVQRKVENLRIFDDAEGKMNLSIHDVKGELLVVSQFTLAARTRKGNRPSFDDAETPQAARKMYEFLVQALKDKGIRVRTGVFGEYMDVSLVNDGPVTILIDSKDAGTR
jgi:D-tyrosyl-tRNA(Tyr) deacylase